MKASAKSILQLALAVLFSTLILAGCNSSSNKTTQANQTPADTVKKEMKVSQETLDLLYRFPTPFEVTALLEKSKAGFIFDMTNPITNVGNYGTEKSRSLNLGIYSADLCYAAAYNRTDETNKLLGCTNKLADQLGIAGVYDQKFIDEVKKSGNKKDTLVSLINRVITSTSSYLSKNNRNQVAVLVVTGGFVEGLYLATALNVVAKNNAQISTIILNQKANYDKLMTVLEAYSADENIRSITPELAKLKPIFTDYGLETGNKLPHDKAIQINDLATYVRGQFIK
jgi:hypothetical protein